MRRMGPALLAVSVAQISLVINTHIASRLAAGSVSWVSYADRLMEFPTALLGVALGTVLLPSLSQAATQGDSKQYSELLDWGLRLVVVLALPCMAGLALMAEPLTALLFNYGRFGARDIAMTQAAVVGYSIGLLGLVAIKVLAPGFYARQDIRTPVKIALAVLVLTQLMNLLTVPAFAHAGLALSISLGALLNAGLLLFGLMHGGHYRPLPGWSGFIARVVAACLAMTLLLISVVSRFDWVAMGQQPWLRLVSAAGLIAAAATLYAICLLALGLRPRDLLRRRG